MLRVGRLVGQARSKSAKAAQKERVAISPTARGKRCARFGTYALRQGDRAGGGWFGAKSVTTLGFFATRSRRDVASITSRAHGASPQ